MSRAQLALASLCIIAAGAAFVAEFRHDTDSAFSVLAVVPVLVASTLRSRQLTLIVAAFAISLQVWGLSDGGLDRNVVGMQIAVYLLTIALAALQQNHSKLAAAHAPQYDSALLENPTAVIPKVIEVTGTHSPIVDVRHALPAAIDGMLTRRERDVVLLAVQGFTARETGAQLYIGERTVETHLANAYGKLGVRSKLEMVRLLTAVDGTDIRTDTEESRRVSA